MNRRKFLLTSSVAVLGSPFLNEIQAAARKKAVKPIEGSWFEFQHHSAVEGKYWNPALEKFTAQQWDAKVKEIAATGMRYLVLLDVAIYDKSFYPSKLLPQHKMGCHDPLEAVSPYVGKILIYQYTGMMNAPNSQAFAGHPD